MCLYHALLILFMNHYCFHGVKYVHDKFHFFYFLMYHVYFLYRPESSRVYSSTNEYTPSGCFQAQSCLDSASYWIKDSTAHVPFMTIDVGSGNLAIHGVVIQGVPYVHHNN